MELLIVVAIIYLCTKINFLFAPLGTFVSTLFVPILISGFLYYLLNPVVNLVKKIRIKQHSLPHTAAVVVVLLAVVGILVMILSYLIPHFIVQVEQLITTLPRYIKNLQAVFNDWLQQLNHSKFSQQINVQDYVSQLQSNATTAINHFFVSLLQSYDSIISMITSISVTVVTVPFLLFYMLKDGPKLLPLIERNLAPQQAHETVKLLRKMDRTISRYVSGQMIECLFVGTFSGIGYSLVGLPYALLVGISAGIANIIPYVGPYIGLVPALILAVTLGVKKVILVCIVCLIVQQVDGNFIYPNVIGKSLSIHPATIIILMLVSGNLAGFVGMILAIPTYAIVKVIVKHINDIVKLRRSQAKEPQTPATKEDKQKN